MCLFIFARVIMARGIFSNRFSSPKSKSFLSVWFSANLSTDVHLYYHAQIKSTHVFKRIILVKLVSLWKWKRKTWKHLSSHVLLSSFLQRSTRTTLQAQVCRVFNHANWPVKMRHPIDYVLKGQLTLFYMGYFDYLFYMGGKKALPLGLTLAFDFRQS